MATPDPNSFNATSAAGRSPDERAVARKLRRETGRARVAMVLERLVKSVWPMATVGLAFYAASFWGLWLEIGDTARLVVLGAFAAAAVFSIVYFARSFRWPNRAEARARLDAERPDRPVAVFDDELALGSGRASSDALWRAHREQALEAAAQTRAPAPDLRVGGRRDPWALRYFAAFALGAALLLGVEAGSLRDAVAPTAQGGAAGPQGPSIEMWATPPAYTGAPPIYFADAEDRFAALETPTGTQLTLRVFNAGSEPELVATPEIDGFELRDEGDGVFAAEIEMTGDVSVNVQADGVELAGLDFRVLPDAAPSIELADEPERGRQGVTTFSFRAEDDYGVVRAWAELKLDETAERSLPPEPQEAFEFDLPTPLGSYRTRTIAQPGDPEGDEVTEADLVEQSFDGHPWVGLPVVMSLVAEDAAGQQGRSTEHRFVLEGRRFSEPMAKALMEQRGALSWNGEAAPRALRTLEAATRYPDDYFDDAAAYLLTRSAISRLTNALDLDRFVEDRPSILERLYEAAKRLEDGDLGDAAERLARAQRRLREALENGASEEELAELMQELREAIDQYLRALAELGQENPQAMQPIPPDAQTLSQDQLQQMLEALQEAMRNGDMQNAEQMLSMLEQLLNSLRPGGQNQQAGQGEQQGQQGQDGQLGELQDLMREQQGLAERSFDEFMRRQPGQQPGQQGEQGQPGQQPGQQQGGQPGQQQGQNGQQQGQQGQPGQQGQQGQPQLGENGENPGQTPGQNLGQTPGAGQGDRAESLGDIRRRQEALREALRDFQRGLDGPAGDAAGEALERAERAMEDAEGDLSQGEPGDAADDQMRAVDALRDGARAAAEAIEQANRDAQQAAEGEPQDGEGEGQGESRDPFGRLTGDGGAHDGRGVDVPGESARSRSRSILQELRRRAGEREREVEELDYFRRLLERFQF
ncbi:MAG: DUF4175 family protein [Pseudomonadota bacterium]